MRTRRNRPIPCTCTAYKFPHRKGGGDCNADKVCPHGVYTPEHPDYDNTLDHCKECARDEAADNAFDSYYDR